jgi:hypothetical protein
MTNKNRLYIIVFLALIVLIIGIFSTEKLWRELFFQDELEPGICGNYEGDVPNRRIWNSRIPLNNSIAIANTFDHRKEFIGGVHSSLTIGVDGLPIIAYRRQFSIGETTTGDLEVIHCGNSNCSENNVITSIDQSQDTGFYPSIVIGADGLPIIAYSDNGKNLKLAKCGEIDCSSGNIVTDIDSVSNLWAGSLTIGPSGCPVIAYSADFANARKLLFIRECENANCSASAETVVVDSSNVIEPSIAIGADGQAIIAFFDEFEEDLRIFWSGGAGGQGSTITIEAEGRVGSNNSITIGYDGLPIISYYDQLNDSLKVAKCGNFGCSQNNTITTVFEGVVGGGSSITSITLGLDGYPVISFVDRDGNLLIARCGNHSCTQENDGTTFVVVDSSTSVMADSTSIAIGSDGLPIVAYTDGPDLSTERLMVAKCGSELCIPFWTRR